MWEGIENEGLNLHITILLDGKGFSQYIIDTLLLQKQRDEYNQPRSYSNGPDNSSDQLDFFDFSKVPDVDTVTRTRMGSKSACLQFLSRFYGVRRK